jgi:hypothetical protein
MRQEHGKRDVGGAGAETPYGVAAQWGGRAQLKKILLLG